MEQKNGIISDLKALINILSNRKEDYKSAIDTTKDQKLKALLLELAVQQELYAEELKAHLEQHCLESDIKSRGVLGALRRIWTDISQVNDVPTYANPVELLQKQVTGLQEALSQIQGYHDRLKVMG